MVSGDNSIKHDVVVLGKFIQIYCNGKHNAPRTKVVATGKIGRYVNGLNLELCDECKKLLLYAASKRIICPYDPKPACKDCTTHCYAEPNRSMIREVMRYSGMRMIFKGSVSYIKKFL
ncbi:MAG: nitrous oxide-stimulated promoter family protein [Spirochaetes bacterium]|nr:nitrous oxide-stimulated promoter family protein [Spirochaetota bacterium]